MDLNKLNENEREIIVDLHQRINTLCGMVQKIKYRLDELERTTKRNY